MGDSRIAAGLIQVGAGGSRHAISGEIARGLFGRGASGVGPAVKDRQTLRDWVHRFNASGPEGLIDNWTEGPKPRLSAEQRAYTQSPVG
jgi:transposase